MWAKALVVWDWEEVIDFTGGRFRGSYRVEHALQGLLLYISAGA